MNIEGLIYDTERENGWVDRDLDLAYIDGAAEDIAQALRADRPAEVQFQPGDGTRYALVFTPLASLVRARDRVVDGRAWTGGAVGGMGHPTYEPGGYLVSHVEGAAAYPVRLGNRGTLAATYVAEHWKLSLSSACSVAILFRAISAHLDALAPRAL